MTIRRTTVIGVAAASVLLTACTSSGHPGGSSSSAASPTPSASSSGSFLAPLLPGSSVSTSAGPWSTAYAATQFSNLLEQFNSATQGNLPTSTSSLTDYVQYSQRIALACDPFLSGLRAGQWPANAVGTIVTFTRLQQTVCDVELARGQAGNVEEYKGVQPVPADTDQKLLDLRVKIYKLLGI